MTTSPPGHRSQMRSPTSSEQAKDNHQGKKDELDDLRTKMLGISPTDVKPCFPFFV